MKRKLITPALTAILGVSLLSACGTNYKVSFEDYWKQTVNQTILQNVSEVCEYDVTFTAGENDAYLLKYQNGTYTTTFTSETNNNNTTYSYSTELSIQVQYTVDGHSSEWLQDSVVSTVKFQASDKGLKPISSEKRTVSHSPASITVPSLATAYKQYDISVVTQYDENCTKATTTMTNNLKDTNNVDTQTFTIKHDTYNYLDNEQLLFAIRCLNPATNASNRFQVYSPFTKAIQKINVNYGTVATKDFVLDIDGNAGTKQIAYYPTTIQLNTKDGNSGADKTVWIAEAKAENNTYRNVILRQEIPVAYNLGTLAFDLKKVNFA